ncbi:DUF4386 domain-containing protein [Maribacter hydrothermalis]|uniref:DUF4386 domain-containing protein n=1 Tax=Maribacter hydrothermalis TaxID=1836467 RepID=A0A1B7Z453_9FLAO|nr:DUF4386 domain-containing protein [Maribacter hydrothermalis]APQ17215.1 hypothetical protein BTR34_07675 [Maribacter hydrothermalis]OBR37474.1 hypothetical protein A9200_07425 [Maribacter hydrothermalis]
MKSINNLGMGVGLLFLLIFVMGILVYQFFQGPILFSDDFLITAAPNSNKLIISVLLGCVSGLFSILISALLFPVFKKQSTSLAVLYVAFSILDFVAISIDNTSVVAMLELSKEYVTNVEVNKSVLESMAPIYSQKHWWTHYLSLLTSCFSVFVLYVAFFRTKLIPRIISGFGIVAVLLMFTELLASILGDGISMNMLLPIGLVQLVLPLWLLVKGLNTKWLDATLA